MYAAVSSYLWKARPSMRTTIQVCFSSVVFCSKVLTYSYLEFAMTSQSVRTCCMCCCCTPVVMEAMVWRALGESLAKVYWAWSLPNDVWISKAGMDKECGLDNHSKTAIKLL